MKELGSDNPKWVFHEGGGIQPPPGHPEILDVGSNRFKDLMRQSFLIMFILFAIPF
jgi:hypothetical protein